jgi:hypothetical protein
LGKRNPNGKIYTILPENMPNGHNNTKCSKIFQMTMKHTNIVHSKALHNVPIFGFLV